MRRRQEHFHRRDRAAVLCVAAGQGAASRIPNWRSSTNDPQPLAGFRRTAGGLVQDADARAPGARCWKAATPASRRCWIGTRRRAIRTTRRGRPSSSSMAWCSRRPRRASAGPPARRHRGRPRSRRRYCGPGACRPGWQPRLAADSPRHQPGFPPPAYEQPAIPAVTRTTSSRSSPRACPGSRPCPSSWRAGHALALGAGDRRRAVGAAAP